MREESAELTKGAGAAIVALVVLPSAGWAFFVLTNDELHGANIGGALIWLGSIVVAVTVAAYLLGRSLIRWWRAAGPATRR